MITLYAYAMGYFPNEGIACLSDRAYDEPFPSLNEVEEILEASIANEPDADFAASLRSQITTDAVYEIYDASRLINVEEREKDEMQKVRMAVAACERAVLLDISMADHGEISHHTPNAPAHGESKGRL